MLHSIEFASVFPGAKGFQYRGSESISTVWPGKIQLAWCEIDLVSIIKVCFFDVKSEFLAYISFCSHNIMRCLQINNIVLVLLFNVNSC